MIADALAKNVVLAHQEREVRGVFDIVEPLAAKLAAGGRTPTDRSNMLKVIGQSLLVRQRLTGRVEVEEKPDVLWDRFDLERLHARLADEYELKERADRARTQDRCRRRNRTHTHRSDRCVPKRAPRNRDRGADRGRGAVHALRVSQTLQLELIRVRPVCP